MHVTIADVYPSQLYQSRLSVVTKVDSRTALGSLILQTSEIIGTWWLAVPGASVPLLIRVGIMMQVTMADVYPSQLYQSRLSVVTKVDSRTARGCLILHTAEIIDT